MRIKVNYPTEPSGIEQLNEAIAEVKATLYLETICQLNVSDKNKKESLKALKKELG